MSLPDLTMDLPGTNLPLPRIHLVLGTALLGLGLASSLTGQQFELVDDLATGSAQTDLIDEFTDGPGVLINGFTLFQGCTEIYGCELWRSDGTAVGTEMMVDLRPGAGEGLSSHEFAVLDGWAYFLGDASGFNSQLWRTDGTPEGTEVFLDRVASWPPPVVIDDLLWFRGDDDAHGEEPWISDGTLAGTMILADIETGSADSDPGQFTAAGGLVYFAAQTAATGRELYATDGTEAGTYLVADVQAGPGDSTPLQLAAYGGRLLFAADDGTTGRELWRSDGTGIGTIRLEINPGLDGSDPTLFDEMPGGFFLLAADDGTTDTELWRTNGTAVQQVVDFNPNGSGFGLDWIRFGDFIYYSGRGDGGGEELLRTDGTASGTTVVADILSAGSSSPRNFVAVGSNLYFTAFGLDEGRELWATDGTVTELVANPDGSSQSSMNSQLTGFRGPGNTLLFAAEVEPFGLELWRTDGTAGGTQRLTDVVDPASSDPFHLTPWQGGLAFQPNDGDDLGALVTVDGTSLSTFVDPFPFPTTPIASSLVEWQGDLYLSERAFADTLTRLWKRELFAASLIAEDTTEADQFSLHPTNAGLAFSKSGTLSVSDGTVVGDFALLELASPPPGPLLNRRYGDDAAWYFVDEQLWRTNLADDTSELLVDLTGDSDLVFSQLLGEVNGTVYFSANRLVDAVSVETLIGATDTSPQGYATVLTLDTPFFVDNDLFALESGAVLLSDINNQNWQLHTLSGPSMPAISIGSGTGNPSFIVAGDRWATFEIAGEGLWGSDGTAGNTGLIDPRQDLAVREVLDDWLVVTSARPGRGTELSLLAPLNGLEVLLPEVEAGSVGSIFGEIVVDDNDVLWASAIRSDVGQELFRLDLAPFLFDPASVLFWNGFESGDASAWSSTSP